MITEFHNRDKLVQLVITNSLHNNANIFSVLVGKNGTGKSTFLGNLTNSIVKEKTYRKKNNLFEEESPSYFPQEVIAVSTSPFDKFPIDRSDRDSNYTYLGLRDLHSSNFGLAYLSKIIASLIHSVSKDSNQAFEIGRVLDYLGYRDEMYISFQLFNSVKFFESIIETSELENLFPSSNSISTRRLNKLFFLNRNGSISERKVSRLKEIIGDILKKGTFKSHFDIVLGRNGIDINLQESDDLLFLIQSGILRLKDVRLESRKKNSHLSIKDASSGEQSIILSILGIASKIKNNSLIVIDEPEICLHPQWQEKYIEILTYTFQNYRGCHFIIATHSPQIISKLSNINSFIIDMETGVTREATDFINNSIDFQLANVFNSPGYKNEYLSRIALNIFVKVSKKKYFDSDDYDKFDNIEKQIGNLDHSDPVYDLYITLKKMLEIYG